MTTFAFRLLNDLVRYIIFAINTIINSFVDKLFFMEKRLKILGIVCLLFGVITFLVSFYSLKIGMPIGFLGMVLSSIYVFYDTKHQFNTRIFTPGIIGMLLSSTPVLVVIGLIVYGYIHK